MTEIDHNAEPPLFDLHVWWSIFVRTKDMRKMRQDHMPAIEAVLSKTAVPLRVHCDDQGPGLFRVVGYQNYDAVTMKDAVSAVLADAYALADGWRINGLGCLNTGKYRHIVGMWSMDKPSHRPPALESMMFEIERGLVRKENEHGGVYVDRPEDGDGLDDEVKNPLRLRPPPMIANPEK